MKRFIEELQKANKQHLEDVPASTEASRRYKEMRKFFSGKKGDKALFKTGREQQRVVTIEEATPSYVLFSYVVFSKSGPTTLRGTSNYNSLICGDDRLEFE